MSTVLIPGSFDPITLGHLDVITRVAARFDRVIVAVMTNDMQKYVAGAPVKVYMFTMQQRQELVAAACAHLANVRVIAAEGLLTDLVDDLGVDWIVKGVRSEADFAYEQKHALHNRAHNPRAETLYLPADPAFDGLSSTLVRERIRKGESLSGYLPEAVIRWLAEHSRLCGNL